MKNLLLPCNVKIEVKKKKIFFLGPYGKFFLNLTLALKIKKNYQVITLLVNTSSELLQILQVNIKGIARGYISKLELVGVGYKSWIENEILYLQLGYSHLVQFKIPSDIKLFSIKNRFITLRSWNFQKLFWFAYLIRSSKKPDIYKGKGVRHRNEILKLKDGKKNK